MPGLAGWKSTVPAWVTLFQLFTQTQAVATPFYSLEHEYISLPDGVFPFQAAWSPDSSFITWDNYAAEGEQWMTDLATNTSTCLTCDTTGNPNLSNGFQYVFPDQKRMLITGGLSSSVFIFECSPSIKNCTTKSWSQVDLSRTAATEVPKASLGRRTYHLSPSGNQIAFSDTRTDGLIMLISELKQNATNYYLDDTRVINPPPPTGTNDTNLARWANSSALTEFKSFADGGASFIFVGQASSLNVDQFKTNFLTGETTRLTVDPDWDEDGSESWDGTHRVAASWRTMHRIDALGLFEPLLSFTSFGIGAAGAAYYVSTRAGFACDLQPWLLSSDPDQVGTIGQPLNPYESGSNIFTANNLGGQYFWNRESNRILIQERTFDPADGSNASSIGAAPNRLHIINLPVAETSPLPVVNSTVGSWATTQDGYNGPSYFLGTHVFPGEHSGFVTLVNSAPLVFNGINVTYVNYSRDGISYVTGYDNATGSVAGVSTRESNLTAVDQFGLQLGSFFANVTFNTTTIGINTLEKVGDVFASWNGTTRNGIPEIGACPNSLPRAPMLILSANNTRLFSGSYNVTVLVTANIADDVRPVMNAQVTMGNQTMYTDANGTATGTAAVLPILVRASAGSFQPTLLVAGESAGERTQTSID